MNREQLAAVLFRKESLTDEKGNPVSRSTTGLVQGL